MSDFYFTSQAIAGLAIQGVLMILLPVALLVIWKKKTHIALAMPVLIGAAAWFLFAILLKLAPAYLLMQANNPVAEMIRGNVWLSYLTAGILAGVFEETGRYLSFRFVLTKQNTRRTAVSYGIGHGGFESVYVGFQILAIAMLGVLLNSGLGGRILAGMDEAQQALLAQQLAPQANATVAECLLGVFERLSAITVHLALSVLVFAAVRQNRRGFLYPVAIALHALFDFSIVLYGAGLFPVWALELLLACFAAVIALFARHVYRTIETDETQATTETDEVQTL